MIISVAFGGFFSRNAPHWLKWVKYLSPIYHAYCLIFYSQFTYSNGLK